MENEVHGEPFSVKFSKVDKLGNFIKPAEIVINDRIRLSRDMLQKFIDALDGKCTIQGQYLPVYEAEEPKPEV
jgi:hypothetical protein